MNKIEPEASIFSSLIKVHYDHRFVRVAQVFVESMAKITGASESETSQLVLLIEECLVFIVDKYIDRRLDSHIAIYFMLHPENKVIIEMTDIGPPIHESKIPKFDIEDERTVSGLWYKLVKGIADDFSFVNLFSDGWLIRISKNIEATSFELNAGIDSELEQPNKKQRTQGEKIIRLATPEDIPQLINLAYSTYRYSYAVDFYNTDLLETYINEKYYEITVVELGGKIIGAYVIKYPKSGEKWSEIGSAMMLPEYRNGSAGRHIFAAVKKYFQDNPRNCDYYTSHVVTTHTKSQRILFKMSNGFKPLFLFLNMVPQPDFIGISNGQRGRESLIHSYYLNRNLNIKKIFATETNYDISCELTSSLSKDVEVITTHSYTEGAETRISTTPCPQAGFAVINIDSFGQDWLTSLINRIISLISSGIESINVNISTINPLPADMETRLASLNLIFCGISLRSIEQLDLAYCLTIKPVDFGNIVLYGPEANKLLEHIKANYM